MPGTEMLSSDEESENRSRSRSPLSPRRQHDDSSDSDLSPASIKIFKIVRKVVAKELAPVKRNLSKTLDTTTQIKGVVDNVKRGMVEVKMATGNIEGDLRKARKSDPKKSLSPYQISSINKSVFGQMKGGKGEKKEALLNAVLGELSEKNVIGAADEDAVKAVASKEFSHLKSHLRTLIKEDLAVGNYVGFPKASSYLKKHVQVDVLSEDTMEFLTIMGLGLARYENSKTVPLSESDKQNKKKIEQHTDYYWQWIFIKLDKYLQKGETFGDKMKNILVNVGYQPTKSEGAVRRAVATN